MISLQLTRSKANKRGQLTENFPKKISKRFRRKKPKKKRKLEMHQMAEMPIKARRKKIRAISQSKQHRLQLKEFLTSVDLLLIIGRPSLKISNGLEEQSFLKLTQRVLNC